MDPADCRGKAGYVYVSMRVVVDNLTTPREALPDDENGFPSTDDGDAETASTASNQFGSDGDTLAAPSAEGSQTADNATKPEGPDSGPTSTA